MENVLQNVYDLSDVKPFSRTDMLHCVLLVYLTTPLLRRMTERIQKNLEWMWSKAVMA
jgi:hypothetical protein